MVCEGAQIIFSAPVIRLIEEFEKLPGVGYKSAQRLAFHVLNMEDKKAFAFADAIKQAKTDVSYCSVCCNFTDTDPCSICSSVERDRSIICVTEWPKDVPAIEKTREYNGLYHVLHGVISPMAGVGPDDIKLKELFERLRSDEVKEIIVATNPNVEGEVTASYIVKIFAHLDIKISRIAHGLPVGSDLEYADEVTLAKSLEGRRTISEG